jgi:UDPglucose 6-dehydrogenase
MGGNMKTLGKPESNSDVVNKHPTTLIVGYGWVGQHIGKYFTEAHWIDDKLITRKASDNSEVEPFEQYELGFICVPTPMLESGRCDTSIVLNAARSYNVKYWCNKSTVEIGTMDKLKEENIKICMSPEYVGETLGHPLLEAKRDPFIILGGEKKVTKKFAEAWTLVTNSYAKIFQTDGKTAELCKLMENSFIATKVMFCNEFYDLAEKMGVDYNELRELWLADPRVSRSHSYVYKDNRGFGGKCLPKDLNNLAWYFRNVQNNPAVFIEFLLKRNAELRSNYENSVPLLGSDLFKDEEELKEKRRNYQRERYHRMKPQAQEYMRKYNQKREAEWDALPDEEQIKRLQAYAKKQLEDK